MPENEAAVEGRPAIQAFYEAKFKENALKIASEPPEIQVLGDWAYERGNGTVTFTPKTGKPMSESLKYLSIVKRQADSTWKYHRLITNNNNPPAAAAAKKK
jgi:ketosteroid isomerase-like protein